MANSTRITPELLLAKGSYDAKRSSLSISKPIFPVLPLLKLLPALPNVSVLAKTVARVGCSKTHPLVEIALTREFTDYEDASGVFSFSFDEI